MSDEIPIGPNPCRACGGEYGQHQPDCRLKATSTESETPRTDAEAVGACGIHSPEMVRSVFARQLEQELSEANSKVQHLLDHCQDAECSVCAEIVCKHHEPLHFHHDGCPSCESNPSAEQIGKAWLENSSLDRWFPITAEELARLKSAIAAHRAQKADDRCIEDDDRLYAAAGLPPCDRRVGSKEDMLKNCARFIERRCEAGGWKSYLELEAEIDALKNELSEFKTPIG